MAFNGLSFIFDGIASERFGLYIYNIGNGGNVNSSGGTKLSLHTDKTSRGCKTNLLGVSEDDVLSFDITFGSFNELNRQDVSVIQRWLFGHSTYKKLKIVQDDMRNVYYNCILNNSEIINIGNVPYAFKCTVVCDSQFAWEEEKEYSYSNNAFIHLNTSDVNDYTYPVVEVKCNASNGSINITNANNNNRTTSLSKLIMNEVITLNGETGIITSSTGLKVLDKFNKKWFELVPNINNIKVSGNIEYIKLRYANARRIGG